MARLVSNLPKVSVISRDPNDDMIIACAIKADADYIITHDDDLLSLGTYKKIIITSPEEFIDRLRREGHLS